MKFIRSAALLSLLMLNHLTALADLKYNPFRFELSTDKESYYEGEKVTFNITITNIDKEKSHPVLLPHTQNTGPKLFCLSAYDKATNTTLLRYTENPMLNMMVHDTGTVQIRFLEPLEQITIPVYLNDFENYYSYHTQNASHHSFGVPLFAGIYKVRINYKPQGIALGDSIYNYYNDTESELPDNGKLAVPGNGLFSNFCTLKIKRSADTLVNIERKTYYIKTDGYRYFYLSKNLNAITTDTHCHHITDLPPDSSSIKNEYFYSHFNYLYAEYIARFEDGDIREYRKFTDWCPSYLYTEKYNDARQRTQFEYQLPDKRFYSAFYNQPSGTLSKESICAENGVICTVTEYIYNSSGKLTKEKTYKIEPCVEIQLDGQTRSSHRVTKS